LPNGLEETFFVDKDKHSVGIVVFTNDNKFVLVKQWRPNVEKEVIEIPGGSIEENEEPINAAKRECKEETGYFGDFVHLASIPYSPYSLGIRHTYLCQNAKKINDELDLDPNEIIKVVLLDMKEVRELIKTGKIRNFDAIYMALDKLNII
jgi:ADP-ribose pyrophosphatase